MRTEFLSVRYICIGHEIILHSVEIPTEDMYGPAELQIHFLFFSTGVTFWTQSFLEKIWMLLQLDTPAELSGGDKSSWEVGITFCLWWKDRKQFKTAEPKKKRTGKQNTSKLPIVRLHPVWVLRDLESESFTNSLTPWALCTRPHSSVGEVKSRCNSTSRTERKSENQGASLASEGQTGRFKHI